MTYGSRETYLNAKCLDSAALASRRAEMDLKREIQLSYCYKSLISQVTRDTDDSVPFRMLIARPTCFGLDASAVPVDLEALRRLQAGLSGL